MKRSEKDNNHHKPLKKRSTVITNTENSSLLAQMQHPTSVNVGEATPPNIDNGELKRKSTSSLMRSTHCNHSAKHERSSVQEPLADERLPYERCNNQPQHSSHSLVVLQNPTALPCSLAMRRTETASGTVSRTGTFPGTQLNATNLSHLLLSPRGPHLQYQLQMQQVNQNNLQQQEQVTLGQVQFDDNVARATLLIQNEQYLNAALAVKRAERLRIQRNQEINRLRQEVRLMQQHHQQVQFLAAMTSPAMVLSNSNLIVNLPPGVREDFTSSQVRYPPSFQRHQQQHQHFPSSLDVAIQMINTPSNQAVVPPSIPINSVTGRNDAATNANSRNVRATPLPVLLGRLDRYASNLSDHQLLLRQQIEVFEADVEDVTTHMRGRNKPVSIGQVGLRCKHCARVPVKQRQKGSTYFPSSKVGIYQAAQNMSAAHISNGSCTHTPDSIKIKFLIINSNRQNSVGYQKTGIGRQYWELGASDLGLIDTEEHGIRSVCNSSCYDNTGNSE